jgi:hypothetical protein
VTNVYLPILFHQPKIFGRLTVYDPKFEVRISSLMGEIIDILPRIEASHTNGGYRGFGILEGSST